MGNVILVEAFHHEITSRDLHWQSIKELKTVLLRSPTGQSERTHVSLYPHAIWTYFLPLKTAVCVLLTLLMFYNRSGFIGRLGKVQPVRGETGWLWCFCAVCSCSISRGGWVLLIMTIMLRDDSCQCNSLHRLHLHLAGSPWNLCNMWASRARLAELGTFPSLMLSFWKYPCILLSILRHSL